MFGFAGATDYKSMEKNNIKKEKIRNESLWNFVLVLLFFFVVVVKMKV